MPIYAMFMSCFYHFGCQILDREHERMEKTEVILQRIGALGPHGLSLEPLWFSPFRLRVFGDVWSTSIFEANSSENRSHQNIIIHRIILLSPYVWWLHHHASFLSKVKPTRFDGQTVQTRIAHYVSLLLLIVNPHCSQNLMAEVVFDGWIPRVTRAKNWGLTLCRQVLRGLSELWWLGWRDNLAVGKDKQVQKASAANKRLPSTLYDYWWFNY